MLLGGRPAYADTCTSSYGSRFSGYLGNNVYDNQQKSFEGIEAVIEGNPGSNCDNGGSVANQLNFVTDWVMIADKMANDSSDPRRPYAQVGYFHYYSSCLYYFTEWKRTATAAYDRAIDTGAGCRSEANARFTASWNDQTGAEELAVNANIVRATPFNPYLNWSEPFTPEISAESKYIQSDIPGLSGDPTSVTQAILQRYDNSWSTTNNLFPPMDCISPQPTRYYRSNWANHGYNFYTDPGGNNAC